MPRNWSVDPPAYPVWIGIVKSLGMTIVFGCLIWFGSAKLAPQWLLWPAFVAMSVGVGIELVLLVVSWWVKRKRRDGAVANEDASL